MGSTSKRGAMTPAAFTLATRSSTIDAVPSATTSATNRAPVRRCRFILLIPPPSAVSYVSQVEAIIPVLKPCNQFFRIAGLFVLPAALAAHDIPNDVTVQLFLKPEGQQLNVLVRVPLKSMRDVVF